MLSGLRMRFALGILPAVGLCASVYVTASTGVPSEVRSHAQAQAQTGQTQTGQTQAGQTQGGQAPAQAPAAQPAQVDYARDIYPILEQTCFECHGPKKGRGQLRLHTRALTM